MIAKSVNLVAMVSTYCWPERRRGLRPALTKQTSSASPRAVHVDCYAGASPCADPVPKLDVQVTAMYVLALLAAE